MDEMVQLYLAILYDLFYQFLLIKFFFIEQREIFQVLNLIYRSLCIFVRLKSACYELFTNFIVEGLKKKKLYNNINVSIGKILGLIVKEESLSRHFFFPSIPYIGFERILILRDTLSDSQTKPNDFYYFPTSYPLFSPLFFITLFFHDNPLRYKSRFYQRARTDRSL